MRRVVVTGMGMVTPLGCGVEPAWQRLIKGESGAKIIDTFDISDVNAKVACMIPRGDGTNATFNPDQWMEPKEQRKVDDFIVYAMCAAKQALDDASWRPESYEDQTTTGVLIGSGIGGIEVPNKKTGVMEPYITLDTAEALAGLAQMGVLEVHPWGSRNDDLERPDRLIFDLDPDESLPWNVLTGAAAEVRARLRKAGLTGFLKTTGGKGLHIVAPIDPEHTWSEVKEFAHNFVLAMERNNPALYLTRMTKSARKGKIYLDYLRNERGATAVAPYSPRARVGATVSLPLPWKDLDLPKRPAFSVKTFGDWKSRLSSDPWKAMLTLHQKISLIAFRAA